MGSSFRRGARRSNTRRTFFGATRAAWMSARARNALRRPVFIALVSIGVFTTALVAFITVPQQARREARLEAAGLGNVVDTLAYLDAVRVARVNLAAADSALAAARATAAVVRTVVPDSMSVVDRSQREAMAGRIVALGELVDRAENAPLPISYRALAESPELRDDPRVRALVDTLTEVEREREAFGAVGGVDPIFVALTSRVNDIGRAIQAIAQERRTALETELASLIPATPVAPAVVAQVDTMSLVTQRQFAQAVLDSTQGTFQRARAMAFDMARRRRAIEAEEGGSASPLTLLAAALVLGAVLGFATAFVDELRRPRLADASEAERVTGTRVLGVIRPQAAIRDRNRRASDRALPPYVDPFNDGHQLSYLHLVTTTRGMLIATVTGDEPSVSAVVAVNLAAVSAEEARNTIVLDTDTTACDVAAALRLHAEPGLVELLDEGTNWADATQTLPIGRSSHLDVIASGTAVPAPGSEEIGRFLQEVSPRLIRDYETVIVVASEEHVRAGLPAALPAPVVVYCARIGQTRINTLRDALEAIRAAGGEPAGLVIWDDDLPSLPTPEELASRSRRPTRTREHRVPAAAT